MSETATISPEKREWLRVNLGVQIADVQAQRTRQRQPQPTGSAFTFAFRKARLEWAIARSSARGNLERLQAGLRDALKGHPQATELNAAIDKLGEAMVKLDERLEDTLDNALNSSDPAKQAEFKQAALKIIAEYQTVADNDPILVRVDANPFMKVAVQSVLSDQLAAMAKELAA
jgi:hypothetical protein